MRNNVRPVLWVLLPAAILAAVCAPSIASPQAGLHPANLLIRIRLLQGDLAARTLIGEDAARRHGSESGPFIRSAAREGKIKPHPGHFRFRIELRNFNYALMQGGTIRLSRVVNGRIQLQPVPIPSDFGLPDANGYPQYWLEAEVLDGEGEFVIHNAWVNTDSVFAIRVPEEVGSLFRPPPPYRVLATCHSRQVASLRCGTYPDMNIGELLNLVRHDLDRVASVLFVTYVVR